MLKLSRESSGTTKKRLRELEKSGYLEIEKLSPAQTSSGRYEYVYYIHECSRNKTRDKKQGVVIQEVEIQGVENCGLLNTNKSSTKISTTNRYKEKERVKKKIEIPPELSEMWTAFVEHRKKMNQPLNAYAKEKFFNKLMNLSDGDFEAANKILQQSIDNLWQGLFPLKGGERYGTNKHRGIVKKPTDFNVGETLGEWEVDI